ncbi:hypothetical protein [Pseudomonas sp. HLMP]|uniref:hypothetical protein n=1 Tax=Pseudomonas sp. HLMP TaxID=3153767 RepID=UPI003966E234
MVAIMIMAKIYALFAGVMLIADIACAGEFVSVRENIACSKDRAYEKRGWFVRNECEQTMLQVLGDSAGMFYFSLVKPYERPLVPNFAFGFTWFSTAEIERSCGKGSVDLLLNRPQVHGIRILGEGRFELKVKEQGSLPRAISFQCDPKAIAFTLRSQ